MHEADEVRRNSLKEEDTRIGMATGRVGHG